MLSQDVPHGEGLPRSGSSEVTPGAPPGDLSVWGRHKVSVRLSRATGRLPKGFGKPEASAQLPCD